MNLFHSFGDSWSRIIDWMLGFVFICAGTLGWRQNFVCEGKKAPGSEKKVAKFKNQQSPLISIFGDWTKSSQNFFAPRHTQLLVRFLRPVLGTRNGTPFLLQIGWNTTPCHQ